MKTLFNNLRVKLSWLLPAVMLFVALGINTQEAKANFNASGTYYFDNSTAGWDKVYFIIGRSDWTQAIEMTDASCVDVLRATNNWDNAYEFFFADSNCGYSEGSGSAKDIADNRSGKYTISYTTKPTTGFLFTPGSSSSSGYTGSWSKYYACASSDSEVLSGAKIMCYGGESTSWSSNPTYYLMNTNSTSDVAASGAMSVTDVTPSGFKFAVLTVAAGTYYHGHWASELQGAVAAGESYIVYGSVPDGYSEVSATSSNKLSKKSGTTTVSFSLGSSSITQGSNLSVSVSTEAGTSAIGLENTIQWYITEQGENDYTKYNLTSGTLNTSSLAIGNYTLKAVLTDGKIFVVGGTKNFEVTAAGTAPTVFIAAEPEVSGANATLHGYLKYTGCQDVTDFGFVWSTDPDEINIDVPAGTTLHKVQATSPEAPIELGTGAGTEFTLTNGEFDGQTTIYYKAYATNIKGTSYSAMNSFATSGCSKPKVTAIELSPSIICDNAGTITATATVTDGATCAWTVDNTVFTGAEVTSNNTATITVATSGAGTISVTPTKAGCTGDPFTKSNITVKNSTITANNLKVDGENTTDGQEISFCEGQEVTFKITSDYAVSTYTWSFPTGWTYVSGEGTKEVVVTVGSGSDNVTATITNECGVSASRYITANVTAIPTTPGKPSGQTSACRGASYEYTVTEVSGAEGYEWVLPTGWTGECSGAGNTITATASMSAQSGTIKVRATNDCGESAYSQTLTVTVGGVPVTISGTGAKSTSATYPWEIFTLTATTTADAVTWNTPTYTGTIDDDLTVFTTDAETKTAKLKSGAPVSDIEHYTVTVKTNVNGCEVTSDGYDVYINADVAEDCGE